MRKGVARVSVVMLGTFYALTGYALTASARFSPITLRTSFEPAQEPLTTEKIWQMDPERRNPHRARWVLERSVNLLGLRSVPISKTGPLGARFGATADGLDVRT